MVRSIVDGWYHTYDHLLFYIHIVPKKASKDDGRQKQSGKNDNNEFPPHKMQMSKKSKKRYYYLESSAEQHRVKARDIFQKRTALSIFA